MRRAASSPHALDGGGRPGENRHICAFFNGLDEHYRVLRSFITEGFDRGDRAFHLVDPERRDAHVRRLSDVGIDVPEAVDRCQLQVQTWEPGPPGGRRFDPDSWLEEFHRALESGPAAGYTHTRFLGQMGWAHRDATDDEDWFDFEARLNAVLAGYEDTVICVYDLTAVSARAVIDALRTHPAVILGTPVQENPFFAPPDQLVAEIQERRARRERARGGVVGHRP